jgi:hypothetical protein
MLDFYIDDSYSSGDVPCGSGVFVLAGWSAWPKHWDTFESHWQGEVIRKSPRPITRLHMSQLENPVPERRGEFQGWTRDEQNQLMTRAVDAVVVDAACPSMFGLAVAIDIAEGRQYALKDLFATALFQMVFDLVEFCHTPVEGLRFAYEADNEHFWPTLRDAVGAIRAILNVLPSEAAQKVFDDVGYMPMAPTTAGLQAADLLAYEIKRRVELRPKPRRSYERLRDGRWHSFRRSIADIDPLPIYGLPTHAFDPVTRKFLFRDCEV